MPAPLTSRLSLSLLLVALTGCADEVDCGPELYAACDIREHACQERVFEAVQCERGFVAGGLPPFRVIDRATYRAELETRARDAEPTPHHDATLRMLELIPEDRTRAMAAIDNSVASIAAFYRQDEQDVTIVDRGEPMDLAEDASILAHELVHVIQDRVHGITSLFEGVTAFDRAFARRAVVEGDATFHQLLYVVRGQRVDPREVRWNDFYAGLLGETLDSVRASDSPGFATGALAYVMGAHALTRRFRATGDARVEDFWERPPERTRELMFDPDTGLTPSRSEATVRCATVPPPGSELELVDEESVGPIDVLALLLAQPVLPSGAAWSLARRIADDRLAIFGDDAGERTAFVWWIRLDSSDAASALEAALRDGSLRTGVVVRAHADEVVIAGATDAALLDGWTALEPCE